jgi:hypothetical protein
MSLTKSGCDWPVDNKMYNLWRRKGGHWSTDSQFNNFKVTRLLIFVALILGTACSKTEHNGGELYVSNHSLDKFDSALVIVTVDDKVIYEDTLTNKYLSFHWDQRSFSIPSDSFRVNVNVSGLIFNVKKDTTLQPGNDRQQIFITFNFRPYHKRYNNPEIYLHLDTGSFDLKKVADSLYNNGILKNADNYLNDTIPLPVNIEIVFKKREEQVLSRRKQTAHSKRI